ncbi:MAG: metal-dependent transcriptional regulator [Clostridia bacterium]|nr:metal-dependent transcriptional regulator [Clostridia bacterium]
MELHESGQMYLETIHVLLQSSQQVRAIDVGEYLGYSKPSVSRALGILKKGGFLLVEEDGSLHLTQRGREEAEKLYERHTVLSGLLMSLGVDEKTATEDACRIEHVLSDKSFDAIQNYLSRHSKQ